jgi:hypothetical protein
MDDRVTGISGIGSDDQRAGEYQRLSGAIVGGTAPPLTPAEVEGLIREVEAAALGSRPGDWCLQNMWQLLSTATKAPDVRELAHRTLLSPRSRARFMAFNYINENFPDEAADLYRRYEKDADPELLYALGWFILPHEPARAAHLWIDAFRGPGSIPLRDTLELEIAGFGAEEHLRRLRELQKENPAAGPIRALADNLEEALRRKRQTGAEEGAAKAPGGGSGP